MIDSLLRDIVTIQRPSVSKSAAGEATQRWTSFLTNVKGSIQPVTGRGNQRESEHGQVLLTAATAYFLPQTDIRVGDRLVHGSRRYDVVAVNSFQGHHLTVDLTLVRNE